MKDLEGEVDIVINSLIEDFIPNSLNLLKKGGCFVELGKRGIWTEEEMKEKRPDIKYKCVAVDVMMEEDPAWFGGMLKRIKNLVEEGIIESLPLKVFDMRGSDENGIDAFRYMQRAQHIGKVIIKIPYLAGIGDNSIPEECLITGGSGSLGLVLTEILLNEGITNISIISRSGIESQSDSIKAKWEKLLKRTLNNKNGNSGIRFFNIDISNKNSVYKLINTEFKNLKHIFHLAGVLSDSNIETQTRESIEEVFKPKAIGAWNLHNICEELGLNKELKTFVMYSSIASGLGNFGQTNYSAANSCLDSLSQYRVSKGLSSRSIQWGAWDEDGMAMNIKQHLGLVGMSPISKTTGQQVIFDLITTQIYEENRKSATIMCLPIKWKTYINTIYSGENIPQFSLVNTNLRTKRQQNTILLKMSKEEREEYIEKQIISLSKSILGIEIKSLDQPLQDIGIDSLAALEFRNALSKKFNIKLSATTLFDYPTIRGIKDHISEKLSVKESIYETNKTQLSNLILSQDNLSDDNVGVIAGLACRFPGGCNTPDTLWKSLIRGYSINPLSGKMFNSVGGAFCASREIPIQRWNHNLVYNADPDKTGKCYSYKACFIDSIDMFDNSKFGITNIEAKHMDPQQRIVLETCYEALVSAKIKEETLIGFQMGVFIGCCSNDWSFLQSRKGMAPFTGTGAANTTISNRVSYVFGMRGPSMTVDTACASSLTAACIAMDSFRNKECNGAIVGGVNALLSPNLFIAFCKARMLSVDGKCKTFDVSADGYVRGEGCGAIVILKQSEQKKQNTPILGRIKGWGCNHVGRSASLTAPNGPAQTSVIKMALSQSKLNSSDIDYIETHGTGTALGDPIELGALKSVFGRNGDYKRSIPLVLGALKSNIGHLEGAAGIAGLIKLVLVLKHETAIRIAHLTKINPHLDLEDFNVIIPQKTVSLKCNKNKLIGGVSGFGFGGCNTHVIVESTEKNKSENIEAADCSKNHILFVFTGQGSQYINMCKGIYETEPIFRKNMNLCNEIVSKILNISLLDIIYPIDGNKDAEFKAMNMLNDTRYAQPAIFAVEYSLAQLWISKGIKPDSVLGHSLGEFIAATISQVMTIEDALTLVTHRATIMASTPALDGIMVACRLTESQVVDTIKRFGLEESASLAAVNGQKSVTISGKKESVYKILEYNNVGSRFRRLDVSHAFHSPLVSEASDKFSKLLENIELKKPTVEFISTVTGKKEIESISTPKYWSKHILNTVRLSDAVYHAIESVNSRMTFIEITSKPILSQLLKALIPVNSSHISVKCTCKLINSEIDFIQPLEEMQELGSENSSFTSHANNLDDDSWRFKLLKRRQISWSDISHPIIAPLHDFNDIEWVKENISINKSNARELVEKLEFTCMISPELLDLFDNHKVLGQSILPGAAFVDFMATVALNYTKSQFTLGVIGGMPDWIQLKGIFFRNPFILSSAKQYKYLNRQFDSQDCSDEDNSSRSSDFNIIMSKGNNCQISIESSLKMDEETVVYATCDEVEYLSNIEAQTKSLCIISEWPSSELISNSKKVSQEDIYEKMSIAGLQYGSRFKTLKEMWKVTSNSAVGIIQSELFTTNCAESLDNLAVYESIMNERGFTIHPTLLDGVLHMCASILGDQSDKETFNELHKRATMVPISINKCLITSKIDTSKYIKGEKYWAFVQLKSSDKDSAIVNVALKSMSGVPIAVLLGVSLRSVKNGVISTHTIKHVIPNELLWRIDWDEVIESITNSEIVSLPTKINCDNTENESYQGINANLVEKRKVLLLTNSCNISKEDLYSEYFTADIVCEASKLSLAEIEATIYGRDDQELPPSPSNEAKYDLICLHIPNSDKNKAIVSLLPVLYLCKILRSMFENKERLIPRVRIITENIFNVDGMNLEFRTNSGVAPFIKSARQELELFSDQSVSLGLIDIETAEDLNKAIILSFVKDLLCFKKREDITSNGTLTESQLLFLNTEYEPELVLKKKIKGKEDSCEAHYRIITPKLVSLRGEAAIIGSCKLNLSSRGAINNLELLPLSNEERKCPSANTVEIRVRSIGLNFRDVLNVMGLYPGDPGPPGGDCSGTVVAVGEGVKHIKVGDNVFGIAPGCLKTYVTTDSNLLCKIPNGFTFEQAAALPVVATTVEY
ncbi:putative acyl transferase, partial [Cryptosporidium hominis]